MTEQDRLRLMVLDAEDLSIVAAHLQDAVLKVGDMSWFPSENRFALALNRLAWEVPPVRKLWRKVYERRRSALHFDRVEAIRSTGFDRNDDDQVLSLLTIEFNQGEAPGGEVLFVFSGSATLVLQVECLEAQLTDLGPAWSTEKAPRHGLGG